jgi:hypothetical protein
MAACFGGDNLGKWGFAREKCATDFGEVVGNRMAAWSLYVFRWWAETALIEGHFLPSMHDSCASVSSVYLGIEMRCDIRQSPGFGVLYTPRCVGRDNAGKGIRPVVQLTTQPKDGNH